MKRIIIIYILFILTVILSQCSSAPASAVNSAPEESAGNEPGYFEEASSGGLAPEFRRSGMISSSTYQVYMQIYAESEDQVGENGLKSARDRAFHLIRKEPFIHSRITENGLQNLKKIIATNGKIIKYVQEGPRTWSIVFQISKIGLRTEFQDLL